VALAFTGWAKKRATDSRPYFCQILTDLKINFSGRFLGKFAVKWIFKIQPHLALLCCYTTLWKINVGKQAINDTLQGSVATYLRCGGVVDNQIKNRLLLSLSKKNKSVNIWQTYKHERDCLVHFARLANTPVKDGESARYNGYNHVLAYNSAR